MKEITKKLYTFKELKAMKVKESILDKIRQKLIEIEMSGEWYDAVYEDWKNALAEIGFLEATINFSGFSSQGDGASFTTKNIDHKLLIKFMLANHPPSNSVTDTYKNWIMYHIHSIPTNPEYKKLLKHDISLSVERTSWHYSHENTCKLGGDINDTQKLDDLFYNRFIPDAETLRRKLCQAIYHSLEQEYNALTSDESLEESDLHFDENGQIE